MSLLSILAQVATVIVLSKCIAFVCDELSQNEKEKQEKLQDEYNDYERKKSKEYQENCRYYENLRNNAEIEYSKSILDYNRKLIKRRKLENNKTFKKILCMLDEQYDEKKKLLNECSNIVASCESSIGKQQNSYVRFKSIKSTIISLQESVYKLEAYLIYLEDYKNKLYDAFETEGKILKPFSMTLPKDYPYEGKLFYLTKDSFDKNHGLVLENAGYVRLDKNEVELFDNSNENSILPFMFHTSTNGKQYFLSLTKGLLKNSIGGTIGIDAEVAGILSNTISLLFKGNQYISMKIKKQDLISQYRKTPIGSNLHVYVKEYDFALKKTIWVSEKISDGLSIAQFDSIVMLQTNEERQELYDYLKRNDLLEEDDEWRIGPIMDSDNNLIGLIMQIGYSYAFKVFFENLSDEKLVLRYGGMLSKEEFLSFDDVFVATNVTVDCYSPNQINETSFKKYFEECKKLQLYLINEFSKQNKMMINSPMNVYLNQWAEITNRLVDFLSYGSHIKISVLEWEYFTIRNIGQYTNLFIENQEEIAEFVEKEKEKNRYKFFIELPKENTRFQCKVIEEDNGEIKLRLNGHVNKNTFLNSNFMFDMYSVAVPYAEKQHANAFSMFKEGRVVNEEIKTAIINTSEIDYVDNGNRINELYNKKIQTNVKQLDAVIRAFAEERFFLIQGPPGTGKTTVIKELILQQLKILPKSRILVVSQANVAVDNVLRGIAEISNTSGYIEDNQIVRCGTQDKIASDIEHFSFEKKYEQYVYKLKNHPPRDKESYDLREKWLDIINNENNYSMVGECLLNCYQIIGATCVGLESRNYGLNNMEFDIVIIDEAGKALAGELLIPINHAKKVIIIGDHKQLPPVINTALYKGGQVDYDDVVENEQQIDFFNRSFFQRLYEDCPNNLKCMLNVQFRMPPVIADLVNMFYDGKLKTGNNCFQKIPMFCNNHLIFIDMKNEPNYKEIDTKNDKSKVSPYNEKEIEAAIAIVTKIRKYYKGRIVVITPYKNQKFKLKEGFKKTECKNIFVNTIDAFQGDEENVVIYCTTRAVKPTKYFSDAARLNVAFSRSKNTLIIIGSSNYLNSYPKDHILRKISDYLTQNAKVIQYKEWLKESFELQYKPINDNTYNVNCINEVNSAEKLAITSIFFDEIKKSSVHTKPTCQACGKDLNKDEYILCGECITKSEKHICKCCGRPIYLSLFNKYVHGDKAAELCENCSVAVCSECNKKFYIQNDLKQNLLEKGKDLLCGTCLKEFHQIVYRYYCDECGNEITLTYAEKKRLLKQGKTLPTVCKNCYQKIYTLNTCSECNHTFSITYGEKLFFESKGLSLPKKCKYCRRKR